MKTAETELPGEAPLRKNVRNAPGAPDIPDHEMIRLIGKGSYGEVWLARGVTGALRAVKVVSRVDFEFDRTFEREFEGIKQFEPISRFHPGLVNILHIGRNPEKGFYHYVMELGDDRTKGTDIDLDTYKPRSLSTDIQQHKRLSMDDCLRFGAFLAEALYYLHEAGLAHRDIKPSNVIFVDGMPKLADIGLVAASGRRTFVGTEGFVPPEGPGTTAADIYSLGMVLYEMSTGKDRLDFPEVPGDFENATERKKWRKLNEVICKACAQNPKRRYVNAREMAFAIERILRFKFRPVRMTTKALRVGVVAGLAATLVALGRNADLFASMAVNHKSLQEIPEIFEESIKVGGGRGETSPVVAVDKIPVVTPTVDPVPTVAKVKIISDPPQALVRINGEEWGTTPVIRDDVPVGEIKGTIKLEGFKQLSIEATLDGKSDSFVVLGGELEYYNPPVKGEPWKNSIGIPFRYMDGRHVATRAVKDVEFEAFLAELGEQYSIGSARIRSGDEAIDTTDRVAMVGIEAAMSYCDWLTQQGRDRGYLSPMQRYVPDESIDYETLDFDFPLGGTGIRRLAVFCAVDEVAFASVSIRTDPEVNAEVLVGGESIGRTPLTKSNMEAGDLTLVLHAEGYTDRDIEIPLEPGEERVLTITLEESLGATMRRPYENFLGMKFVPLGDDLLVSQWETRVGDMDAFCESEGRELHHIAPFLQEIDHPAVLVSKDDAMAFCDWLTKRDREAGFLGEDLVYRLPRDTEWSRMCGLEKEPGNTPSSRDSRTPDIYPWGVEWPPPEGVANLADQSAVAGLGRSKVIPGYNDDFAKTSPAGSFAPNQNGIHDLAGNAWEWVEDSYGGPGSDLRWGVARGGGYSSAAKDEMLVSYRNTLVRSRRYVINGFRCVIARVDEGENE